MMSLGRHFPASGAVRGVEQPLSYPVTPCPAIAVFSQHFALIPPMVRAEHAYQLHTTEAATAAAPLSVLQEIDPAIWSPEYPLIVFSTIHRGLLSPDNRDYLWEKFGVPVFEYLLDTTGRLLAAECEAHDGLHVLHSGDALNAVVVREPCACGKSTPRLLVLGDIIEESVAVPVLTQEWRNWQTHQT